MNAVINAENYYDDTHTNIFYESIAGGGTDIHVGFYEQKADAIGDASRKTVDILAKKLLPLVESGAKGLDIGAGYGGPARYLAATHGFEMTCLNISAVQNHRNRKAIEYQQLTDKVTISKGSFQDIPFEPQSFDFCWSQDALVHSVDRAQVFSEVNRVLRPGGIFILTDLMQADGVPTAHMMPIFSARVAFDSMGSFESYRKLSNSLGWSVLTIEDHSHQAERHYQRTREELLQRRSEIADVCGHAFVDRHLHGLECWIQGFESRYLKWGILIFKTHGSALNGG